MFFRCGSYTGVEAMKESHTALEHAEECFCWMCEWKLHEEDDED
jgi:hypothetical protein